MFRGQLLGVMVFRRHIWVKWSLSKETAWPGSTSAGGTIVRGRGAGVGPVGFGQGYRSGWRGEGEGTLGSQGWEASRYARMSECFAEHAKLQSHREPCVLIIITVIPTSKPQGQYFLGINTLKWYLRNQPLPT